MAGDLGLALTSRRNAGYNRRRHRRRRKGSEWEGTYGNERNGGRIVARLPFPSVGSGDERCGPVRDGNLLDFPIRLQPILPRQSCRGCRRNSMAFGFHCRNDGGGSRFVPRRSPCSVPSAQLSLDFLRWCAVRSLDGFRSRYKSRRAVFCGRSGVSRLGYGMRVGQYLGHLACMRL